MFKGRKHGVRHQRGVCLLFKYITVHVIFKGSGFDHRVIFGLRQHYVAVAAVVLPQGQYGVVA